MSKKLLLVVGTVLAFVIAVSFWVWKKYNNDAKQDSYVVQQDQVAKQEVGIDTTNWKTYRNEKYRFEIKLPENNGNDFEIYVDKFSFEVGQEDRCQDCALITFVTSTKDDHRCAFPGYCGKAIVFTIRVRDVVSWRHNHLDNDYACIDESKVLMNNDNYVYTLCPREVNEISSESNPDDIIDLLTETLPSIISTFHAY